MDVFITLTVLGLVGLVFMALPGMSGHGGGHTLHAGHAPLGHAAPDHALGVGAIHSDNLVPVHIHPAGFHAAGGDNRSVVPTQLPIGPRFLPNPRRIFTVIALYGASGYAIGGFGIAVWIVAVTAIFPALLLEWLFVTPLWNALFKFEGQPDTDLEALMLEDCEAVTPFHNGRGIIQVVRDGRMVQFSAHLTTAQTSLSVDVGTHLRIEEVDTEHERMIVSIE